MKPKIELNSNAISLRRKFGIDDHSKVDVFELINSITNLTLVFYPLQDKISGMSSKVTDKQKLLVINSTHTYGRQRFTASHELYHQYFQPNFRSVICSSDLDGEKDEEEQNADAFASYFLAPYDALNNYILFELEKVKGENIVLSDIVNIEQHFGISRGATIYRLIGEGYLPYPCPDEYKNQIIQSAKNFGYDIDLYVPLPEEKQYGTSGSYLNLAKELFDNDKISDGKYESYLLDAFRSDIVYNLNPESRKADD